MNEGHGRAERSSRTSASSRARPVVVYALDHRSPPPSSFSRVAFFAKLYGAELRILRVVPQRVGRRSRSEESLSELPDLAAIGAEAGSPVRIEERRGSPRPMIIDYARRRNAVLLAVDAMLGADSVRRIGTVVSRLGRSLPCPLLVLPRSKRQKGWVERELREVLCTLDHGPASAATLDAALFIAREARSRLTLLHVLQRLSVPAMLSGMQAARVARQCEALADAERERLRKLVPGSIASQQQLQFVIGTGEPRRAIARTTADVGAQLIVMGVVPRNLVDVVLLGSTSGPVIRRASVPVLLIPPLSGISQTKSRSSHDVESLRRRSG